MTSVAQGQSCPTTNSNMASEIASIVLSVLFIVSESLALSPKPKASGIVQGIVDFIKQRFLKPQNPAAPAAPAATEEPVPATTETQAGEQQV